MKPSLIATMLALFMLCAVDAETFLFPVPQEVRWTGHTAELGPRFEIQGANHPHVEEAAKRYERLVLQEHWTPVQVANSTRSLQRAGSRLDTLQIKVHDNKVKLDMGVDESYELNVPTSGGNATLKSKTWVGALRGLETFSQLVVRNKVHTATITDYPSFPHRGLLLDTSRNFYPVDSLLHTIDAMAYNKMNVFHWHATDSQSWPLHFESHPELAKHGAYSPDEVYSPQDVNKIIQHAESRGVRVIIEIDMPAHTASIADSHPDYMTCIGEWWGPLAAEPPAGQLNPIHPGAWKLIKDLVKEATNVFPDSLYHMGGDEINTKCWDMDKSVAAYAQQKNLTMNQIWFNWTNSLFDFVIKETKKRPIIWEDPLKDGGKLGKETIVQIWTTPASNYTAIGHDVIVSSSDYFYLDCGHGGWVGNDIRYISPMQTETANDTFNYGGIGGSWCAPFKTWQRIYSYDMTLNVPADHPGRVLGGEVALWSEQSDETVLDARLWPRAAAAAEVYWSGSYDKHHNRRTLAEVQPRFNDWRYRLVSRGIGAEPNQPRWCLKHPGQCDLNSPY